MKSTKHEILNPKQIQNSNVQIFKTYSKAVILSEAKNLIIRRPDPSASPQDDTTSVILVIPDFIGIV